MGLDALTQKRVQEVFGYSNGELIWKLKTGDKVVIGEPAGTPTHYGYIQIGLDKKLYKRSRLIFLWHHGYLPKVVDHVNHERSDDRIENLRDASHQENSHNSVVGRGSCRSRGVCYRKRSNNYHSQIRLKGRSYHIGVFETEKEASEAYERRRGELFPGLVKNRC